MSIREKIARAIAPYEAELTPETLATADRVIEAMREPDEAMVAKFFDPCPDCGAGLVSGWSGLRCVTSGCGYWFCY